MWPDVRPCVTCVRVHDRSRPYVATWGPTASRVAVVVRIPHTHYETQRSARARAAGARALAVLHLNERREERVFQSRGSTCLEFINFAFGDRIRVGRSARAHTRGAAKSRYTFYKCKSLRHISRFRLVQLRTSGSTAPRASTPPRSPPHPKHGAQRRDDATSQPMTTAARWAMLVSAGAVTP